MTKSIQTRDFLCILVVAEVGPYLINPLVAHAIGATIYFASLFVYDYLGVDLYQDGIVFKWLFGDGKKGPSGTTYIRDWITSAVMIAPIYFFMVRSQRLCWNDLGYRSFDKRWLAIAGIFFIADWVLSDVLIDAFRQGDAAWAYIEKKWIPEDLDLYSVSGNIILYGLITGVIEETYFRGVIHRWLRQHTSFLVGITLSAAFFAVVHSYYAAPGGTLGWIWTAEIMLFGVITAYLYEKSGSLWPSILYHTAYNTLLTLSWFSST